MAAKKKSDRMPENAVNGTGRGQLAAEMLPMRRGSSVGMAYNFPNPRGEEAGYTTSSPGWGQPMAQPPASLFPPAPVMPAVAHPAARPDRGPQTTSAIGGGGGASTPTPEMIANATTTPSALFQPFNGPVPGNATTSPSALWQPLPQPGAHGQPPAPQSIYNPASMGQPPAPQGVVDLPALGQPPAPQAIVAPPPPPAPGPFPARPAPQIAPNVGDIAAMPEGAARPRLGKKTPLAKKGGRVGKSQYRLTS